MKPKLTEDGNLVLEDGMPVYIEDDGTEKAVDVAAMASALSKANGEAAKFRSQANDAKARLKLYGDLDPSKAQEAVAFRDALGDDIDPEKVSHQLAALKAENKGLSTQLDELQGERAKLTETVDSLSLGVAITSSKFIGQKVAPALRDPDLFRAAYGKHLDRDEQGNVVVKDAEGSVIYEGTRPATLDEALPKLVKNPAHLAAGNASGGGESGGSGGGSPKSNGSKKWNDLDRGEMIAAIREHGGLKEAQEAFGG